jgi:hypothetical protein
MKPWKQLQRLQWDCGGGFGGFNETGESLKKFPQHYLYPERWFSAQNYVLKSLASAVSMRPQKRIRRSQLNRRSGFSSVNETAEADSAVSMRPRNPWWHSGSPCEKGYWFSIPLKGYYSKNKYIMKHYIILVTRSVNVKGELQQKKSILVISESNFSANSKPYAKQL